MPKCDAGSQDITITATTPSTQTTNSVVFTYTEPMATANVYSISPQSANPSLKGVMQIVGTGFGTDLSAITIYLSNASGNVYQMRVLTINNTNIQAGISGGLSGAFEVKLYKKNFGAILPSSPTATQFTYELVINSISPTTGSYYGGTLINLKGINFATNILQTLVFVGDAMNWICDVESVTSTDILCRTPPINPDYNVSDPQLVLLTNRLIVDNTCPTPANCQFTYIAADASPQITSISLKVVTSGTGSLNIMGLNFGSNCQVVLVN